MKRIKQIIEALKVITHSPTVAIKDAWSKVQTAAIAEQGHGVEHEIVLLSRIVDAVCGIADDMERPAKAEGEAAK